VTPATWYFDFISPFAYLQFARLPSLSTDFDITLKPVLFSALLKHWGQKGPAEISSKRRFVYRFFKWQADRRGIPFTMPAVHPFNPLPPLRLAIAAGATMDSVRMIFHHIYGEGNATSSAAPLAALASRLGLDDVERSLSGACVKDTLRANTQVAIAQGVFGVPTFVVDGEIFWGDDATDMLRHYAVNRDLFNTPEMVRLSSMPMGLARPG
jgi:2-hydroxychromene-2-carboxylate isomerase